MSTYVRPSELKVGDKTDHYEIIEPPFKGLLDEIHAKIRWNDGGVGYRVWDQDNPTIAVTNR